MWRFKFVLNMLLRGEFWLVFRMSKQFILKNLRMKITSVSGRKVKQQNYIEVGNKYEFGPASTPLVTVVMPHVNYSRFLQRSLNSVLSSSLTNFQVKVLESGSDPEEVSEVRTISGSIKDPRVNFDFGPRRKLGANRNLGVESSESAFICSFDPDDELGNFYLEIALFNCIRNCLDVSGAAMHVSGLESGIWDVFPKVGYRDLIHRNALPSNAIFTREIWKIVGGFIDSAPDEPHIHEDWRFWQRAALHGARIQNVTKPLTTIHIHGKNMSRQSDVVAEHVQARLIREKNSDVVVKVSKVGNRNKFGRNSELRSPDSVMEQFSNRVLRDEDKIGSHIIFFVPWIDQSGSIKVLEKLAGHFQNNGSRITFVSTQKMPAHAQDYDIKFEHFILPDLLENEMWFDFVVHLIRSRRTTQIWQSGSVWLYENIHFLQFTGVKFIDSLYIPGSYHLKMSASLSDFFDIVYFESIDTRNSYLSNGGKSNNYIIPNGVDKPRKNLGVDFSNRKYITFLGRLAPEKDPLAFLNVVQMAQLIPSLKNRIFVIAGSGPLDEVVKREISNRGLNIMNLGHLTDTEKLLQNSFLLIQTSTPSEGRPNVLLEAAANGVPVIAHNVGGVSTIVEDGKNGYLVQPGDYEKIVQLITELNENQNKWNEMSENSIRLASTVFSWEPSLEKYTQTQI